MMWFLGALGLSLVCAFIGWKKSPKKRKPEPEVWLSGEYARMYYDCLDYMERLYQQK